MNYRCCLIEKIVNDQHALACERTQTKKFEFYFKKLVKM